MVKIPTKGVVDTKVEIVDGADGFSARSTISNKAERLVPVGLMGHDFGISNVAM